MKKLQVLVVDDSKTIRFLVEKGLSEAGFHVLTATNGKEGLDMVKIRTPDLIRVKVRVYLMISLPLSLIFLIIVSLVQMDAVGLLISIPLVIVMVPYMGYVTAYLTGLWTNSMLFDSSVFIRYLAMAVGPLMFATLLSMLMDEMDILSLVGIAVIITGSAVSALILSRSLEKKWDGSVITSSGGMGD